MLLAAALMLVLLALPMTSGWGVAYAPTPIARPARARRGLALSPRRRAHVAKASMLDMPNLLDTWSSFREALQAAGANVVFERGALRILDPDLAAFVGGAVGVIGTLESIMSRRRAVRERLTCVYCDGAGTLTCGVCVGSGRNSAGMPCVNCNGLGKVACVSCQGSGNSVLLASDRNLIRELAGLGTMQDELETEIDR